MSTEIDQAFVEYVVKALVSNPEAVEVNRSVDEMGVLLELTVDPSDMGKVIGKAGATAKSIRTLLRVLGAKHDARVNLKIVEPEGSEARHEVVESFEEEHVQAPVEDTTESDIREQTKREIEELADLDI